METKALRWSALALTLVCFASCGTNTPVDVPAPGPTELSGTLDAAGGTLVSGDGKLRITVPAGALANPTDLNIRETDSLDPVFGAEAEGVGFVVEPAGLTLASPAEIEYQLPITPQTQQKPNSEIDIHVSLAWQSSGQSVEFPDQRIDLSNEPMQARICFGAALLHDFALIRARKRGALDGMDHLAARFMPPGMMYQGQDYDVEFELESSPLLGAVEFLFSQDLGDGLGSSVGDGEVVGEIQPTTVDETTQSYLYPFDLVTTILGVLQYHMFMQFALALDPLAALYLPPGWITPPPAVAITVGFNNFEVVSEECVEPGCVPPGGDVVVINSDMTNLGGIRVGYTEVDDPTPFPLTGQITDPWLYLVGAEGVTYYRIDREDDGRVVEGAILTTPIPSSGNFGVLPLSYGTPDDRIYTMAYYGEGGLWRTNWNASTLEYGAIILAVGGIVSDVSRYGSVSDGGGATVAVNSSSSVRFLDFDAQVGFFTINASRSIFSAVFDGRVGNVVSAYASGPNSGVVVVMSGSPGQIWAHDLVTPQDPASLQGVAGNDPRQVRGAGNLLAISNYGSDNITVATWNHAATVSVTATADVGDGPEGIDIMALANGNYAIVSTGSLDGTYTVTEVTAAGSVVSQTTGDVPTPCTTPKHAVFVRGPIVYLAFSCFGSGNVVLQETALTAAP